MTRIQRRGKGLLIELSNKYVLAVHVKMTGQLVYRGQKTKDIPLSSKVGKLPNVHTRIIFTLDKGAHLYYNDIRRFGWIYIVPQSNVAVIPFFKSLGPEPFGEKENNLTLEYFSSILKKSVSPVKSVILDQHKIGGIGNIYANDALYEAKIDPRRSGKSLTNTEVKSLYKVIHDILLFSIEKGGASDKNFVNAIGQDGKYQENFKVYGKKNVERTRCGESIKRIVLAGRATFICFTCQK